VTSSQRAALTAVLVAVQFTVPAERPADSLTAILVSVLSLIRQPSSCARGYWRAGATLGVVAASRASRASSSS